MALEKLVTGLMLATLVCASEAAIAATGTVSAAQMWGDTGISVTAGSTYTLTASGSPYRDTDGGIAKPNGSCPGSANSGMPDAPQHSLICRVGTGSPFFVGSNATITMSSSGALQCAMNEDPFQSSSFYDNSGSWSLDVQASSTSSATVSAAQMWGDTGISVTAGSTYTLTASGSPYRDTDGGIAKPNGSCPGSANSGMPDAPQHSLICRVGTGSPFFVGSNATITMSSSGALQCAMNEDPFQSSSFYDNSGSWTLSSSSSTATYTLSVTSSGASGVAISSSTSHGGTTDYSKTSLTSGTSVSLTAPSTAGTATFSSWSGCDSTSGYSCSVTMTAAKTVTATYIPATTATLTVNSSGASSVAISSSTGHGGTTDYSKTSLTSGTSVNLTAPSTAGTATFSNWSGCDSTSGYSCSVTMTAAKTVTATYTPASTSSSSSLSFSSGWNLSGNGTSSAITVASVFGDTAKVATVWKWNAATSKWAFYSPSMQGQTLTDYAAGKGYDVLTTINAGEGFWVNAKAAFSAAVSSGASSSPTLQKGWNLVAVGTTMTPKQFNDSLSDTPPSPGASVSTSNLTSLWTWDNAQSKWYFYSPNLEAQGGTALADYIASEGYLDFTTANKTLGAGIGFWVNKP